MKIPALEQRIERHADAVIAGDDIAAESFLLPSGLEVSRAAFAQVRDDGPPSDFELLACAKIGKQFIAKTRFAVKSGPVTLLIRWKEIDGQWMIAEVENITGKRSPWSDIPHYAREPRGVTNA